MIKLGVGLAAIAAALSLGSATASAYPPPPPPPTPTTAAAPGAGQLPATGSEAFPIVQVGSGVIAAGVGLIAVGGMRRRRLTQS